MYDSGPEISCPQQSFYMNPERAQYIDSYLAIEDKHIIKDTDSGYQTEVIEATIEAADESGSEEERQGQRVYLTIPKELRHTVTYLMCKVPSAQHHPPVMQDTSFLMQVGRESNALPSATAVKKLPVLLPEIKPVDVQRPRFDIPQIEMDTPMPNLSNGENHVKKRKHDSAIRTQIPTPRPDKEEPLNGNTRSAGRQSELQSTVDINGVLEHLLNLTLPLSVGEAFALSKEI
ncbi:hypothetical protein C8J57DRAFT_1249703 [Mycena rebaudengoi]|nr:hypothetical protein C8J57DRAFT_1249703 [Mycena rebaudengoi]